MKPSILIIMVMSLIGSAMGQTSKNMNYNLLVGTYTNAEKTNGIHVYNFNTQTGEFDFKSKVVDITNPSYLTISVDKKNVYAVSEVGNGKGRINSFSFDPVSGKLIFLNSTSSGGDGPCYISIDNEKQYVFSGNYGAGSLSAIEINEDGSLSDNVQSIQHEGSSVNKDRQTRPHVHAAVVSPDNHYVFAPDLGTDKVNIYRYDPIKSQPLMAANPPYISVKPGSGPRHLTFHPNGKFAYLILEMEGAIVVYDYKDGELKEKQTITMLAPNFEGEVGAADIHVSPDGKFLYGSNRGDANELVIYSIGMDGKLNHAGRQSTLIHTPRNFVIDPTGNFLLVANLNNDDVVIFKRNKKTGLLTPTGQNILVDRPVCLKFVATK